MRRVVDFSSFIALGLAVRLELGIAQQSYIAGAVAVISGTASTVWDRHVNPLISGAYVWFILEAIAFLVQFQPVGLALNNL